MRAETIRSDLSRRIQTRSRCIQASPAVAACPRSEAQDYIRRVTSSDLAAARREVGQTQDPPRTIMQGSKLSISTIFLEGWVKKGIKKGQPILYESSRRRYTLRLKMGSSVVMETYFMDSIMVHFLADEVRHPHPPPLCFALRCFHNYFWATKRILNTTAQESTSNAF